MTAGPPAVTDRAPARGRTARLLIGAAVLSVAAHLYGLYRLTGPPSPSWFPNSDKVEHALGFGLPVFLILLALLRSGRCGPAGQWLVVAGFAGHAVVSELIQSWFYTYRTSDPRDVLADWIGVALGWVGYRLVAARSARRRR